MPSIGCASGVAQASVRPKCVLFSALFGATVFVHRRDGGGQRLWTPGRRDSAVTERNSRERCQAREIESMQKGKAAAIPLAKRGEMDRDDLLLQAEWPDKNAHDPRQNRGPWDVLSRQNSGVAFVHSDVPERAELAIRHYWRELLALVAPHGGPERLPEVPNKGVCAGEKNALAGFETYESHWLS
jgi:hypothetical protein